MSSSIRRIMGDIKSLRIQGARSVALAGVRILRIQAKDSRARTPAAFIRELKKVSREVVSLRPTEPALRYGQELILSKLASRADVPLPELKGYALKLCVSYARDTESAVEKIAANGARGIRSGDVIMTHCHSHCVMEILKRAKRDGKKFTVIVTETRPLYQGTITARELSREKIKVVYCVDAASAAMMGKTDKVLVGCDAITAGGDVVNKIGTYQIAIEAKEYKVPFIVASGTHKYDSRTSRGFPEPIEERDCSEVAERRTVGGAKIVNPAFDVTPKEYIDEIITEIGVYSPETLVSIIESRRGKG